MNISYFLIWIYSTWKPANGKIDEEEMKKMSGFCESLVSSQFLFHQSRYCSLFAPFPALSHHLVLIMQAKHALFDSEGYKVSKKTSWASWYQTFERNSQSLGRDRVVRSWRVWSKKMVFAVTPILSSTSIPRFHFLPSHSLFLSRLLVMLLYQTNIGQDVCEQWKHEDNASNIKWQITSVAIHVRYSITLSFLKCFRFRLIHNAKC